MTGILVVYHSRSGNTEAMAKAVAEGVCAGGVEAVLRRPNEVRADDLLEYEGMAVGSPAYYGMPAAEIMQLFDDSVTIHGQLAGRPGIAFSSAGNLGGGGETVCMGILQMMLVHGMVALGHARGAHYGPVSVGHPDEAALTQCRAVGEALAKMVLRLRAGV